MFYGFCRPKKFVFILIQNFNKFIYQTFIPSHTKFERMRTISVIPNKENVDSLSKILLGAVYIVLINIYTTK